jgi:hypothetical protein
MVQERRTEERRSSKKKNEADGAEDKRGKPPRVNSFLSLSNLEYLETTQ